MAASDPYGKNIHEIGSARNALAITPSDTVDLPNVTLGITIDLINRRPVAYNPLDRKINA